MAHIREVKSLRRQRAASHRPARSQPPPEAGEQPAKAWDDRFHISAAPEYDAFADIHLDRHRLRRASKASDGSPGDRLLWLLPRQKGPDIYSSGRFPVGRDREQFLMERLWTRSLARLKLLWQQLQVAEGEQQGFAARHFTRVTAANLQRVTDEIRHLLPLRDAAVRVFECIDRREARLRRVELLVARFETHAFGSVERLWQELVEEVEALHRDTADCIEAHAIWQKEAGETAELVWQGRSYLAKMVEDAAVLRRASVAGLFGVPPNLDVGGATTDDPADATAPPPRTASACALAVLPFALPERPFLSHPFPSPLP
eukprot:EG_transcript_20302